MDLKHILQSLHESLKSGDGMMVILPIFGMIWLFWMVKGYLIPSLKTTKDSIKTSEAAMKAIEAMIEAAVKRAPPIEAKPAEEGAPFEEYRKDLWRMVDGEISIDEFVNLWRGRKVQKRPAPEKKLTPEEIEQAKNSEIFKTITSVISEFSKGIEQAVSLKKFAALEPGDWQQQEYRIEEIQKELGTNSGSIFLVLWAQHLKNSDPGKLADYFVASLQDPALEGFGRKFLIFMKNREWDQVLTAIEPKLQVKELFQSAYAEIFFIGFRDGVVRRLEEKRGPVGTDGGSNLEGPPGVSGTEFLTRWAKEPKYRLGDFVRVKRPTSPGFDQIARIQSVHDNGIEWDYIMELRNAQGNGFIIGLPQSEVERAEPREGEWWKWVKNDGCMSVYRPGTYEPFQWKGKNDNSISRCCREGCLVPVNFGRGE